MQFDLSSSAQENGPKNRKCFRNSESKIPCWKRAFAEVITLSLVFSHTSTDVCQHLWECFGHHPASVLWNGQVPHPDAEGPRVYPLPPDSQPASPKAGGVFPACLVLH